MTLNPDELAICLRALPLLLGDMQYVHDLEKARGSRERRPAEMRQIQMLIVRMNKSEWRRAAHDRNKQAQVA